MDGSMMLHFDEKEDAMNPEEMLARRLKNRERQRRYRARKRHEADIKKMLIVDQSTPLHYQQMPAQFQPTPMQVEIPVQVDISINISSPDFVTRVHSRRDWKKDARSAHLHKQKVGAFGTNISETATPGGSQAPSLQSSGEGDFPSIDSNSPVPDNNGTQRSASSRRHWKSEARNKKLPE